MALSKLAVVALPIKQSGRIALVASLLALYLKRRKKVQRQIKREENSGFLYLDTRTV